MTLDEAMTYGSAEHDGGAWRISNHCFKYLDPESEWIGFILLSLTAIAREGWRGWNGLVDPFPDSLWKNVVRLKPDSVIFRDGVFTPHGMRVAAAYCRSLMQGERRIDIESRYEDAFGGSLQDFLHWPELCAEHAEYEEEHVTGSIISLF